MSIDKNFKVEITKEINLQEIFYIYRETGWIDKSEKFNEVAYKKLVDNSFCFAVVKNNGKIISMGRSISDGISDAYIQDVAVLKEFRGLGIGKKIIESITDYLKKNNIGWIALIAEPGAADFYKKLDFEIMPDFTPMKYTIHR